ncbi:DUF3999 family protein [Erwinia persicina]|uniref:DUF3999 family protein n=1 Tax=Erwinia persicina TaxID=55211 RepID=UPI00178645A0|nr:DUF3999 family protein [Erwinia persicina]MBD8214881.1 DUF3999 domain-containing protein [Erwinia persicina]
MKNKISQALLLVTLYLMAGAAANANEVPKDYAYGLPLMTPGAEPFYRVKLPEEVYQQTAWPDMRDLRVFNSQGMTVPFALYSTEISESKTKTWPLRVFPMNSQPRQASENAQVTLKSASGIEVTLPVEGEKPLGRSLLLEVPQEGEGFSPRLSGLKLTWERLPQNWQARVSVFYSSDLKDWEAVTDDAPLMDLTSGDSRLLLDTLDFNEDRGLRARYLMLVFKDDAQPENLNLSAISGIEAAANPVQHFISLTPSVKAVSASEAEYSWSTPQPLIRLKITPAQSNAVLPVHIDYRSTAEGDWLPLADQVVYSLGENASAPLILQGALIQAIRVKGVHQQWSGTPPLVSAEREVRKLVFNAQGSAPYMLVWGNKNAGSQVISLDQLIPQETHPWMSLPDAGQEGIQTLGGRERLTATAETEKSALWQKGLLWALLIIGAGGLVLLALKVWREVQRQPK